MSLNLRISINELSLRMNRYVMELKREAKEVVRTTTRLLIKDLLKITPPKNLGQGTKAVERDVTRAMTPFDLGKVRMPRLRKLVRTRNYAAINSIMKRTGGKWATWEVVPVSEQRHTSVRDKRGRVRRFMRKFILDKPAWRVYLRKVKAAVGKLKAGWTAAYHAVGGAMPSWISRHGTKYGAVIDLSNQSENPSITIKHAAPHNGAIDAGRLAKAIDMRVRAMDTDIRKGLERARQNSNL